MEQKTQNILTHRSDLRQQPIQLKNLLEESNERLIDDARLEIRKQTLLVRQNLDSFLAGLSQLDEEKKKIEKNTPLRPVQMILGIQQQFQTFQTRKSSANLAQASNLQKCKKPQSLVEPEKLEKTLEPQGNKRSKNLSATFKACATSTFETTRLSTHHFNEKLTKKNQISSVQPVADGKHQSHQ